MVSLIFFINQLYAITSTELTFFYHLGCFYHGCKCLIGKTKLPDEMTAAQRKKIAAKRKKIAAKKRNKDKIRNAYTRRQGYNLVIKKECEWRKVKIAVSNWLNVCENISLIKLFFPFRKADNSFRNLKGFLLKHFWKRWFLMNFLVFQNAMYVYQMSEKSSLVNFHPSSKM